MCEAARNIAALGVATSALALLSHPWPCSNSCVPLWLRYYVWSGDESALHDPWKESTFVGEVQGPVRAAIRYGKVASWVHGPDGIPKFPAGCKRKRSRTFRRMQRHAPVVPASKTCGQGLTASNGCLPAGIPAGTLLPVLGTVRLKEHNPEVRPYTVLLQTSGPFSVKSA
jgi:hypothetical protein